MMTGGTARYTMEAIVLDARRIAGTRTMNQMTDSTTTARQKSIGSVSDAANRMMRSVMLRAFPDVIISLI